MKKLLTYTTGALLCGSFLLSSCKENNNASATTAPKAVNPLASSSGSSKFDKVLSQLDKGGSFLMYEETDYSGFNMIKDLVLDLPQVKDNPANTQLVNHIYQSLDDYGLFGVEAYGISNKKKDKGNDFKVFAITQKGYESKTAALLSGGSNARLKSLQHIAADADMVVSLRLNPGTLYDYVLKTSEGIAPARDFTREMKEFPQQLKKRMNIDFDKLKVALNTEISVAVKLIPGETMNFEGQEIPAFKAKVIIANPNGYIGELLQSHLLKRGIDRGEVAQTEKDGWKLFSPKKPLPVPVTPQLAISKDWIVLTSDDKWLLPTASENFTKTVSTFNNIEMDGQALKANSFFYIKSSSVVDWAKAMVKNIPMRDSESELMQKLVEKIPDGSSFADLWLSTTVQKGQVKAVGHSPIAFTPSQIQIAYIGVVAAMVMPALSKARAKAEEAQAMNKLKQLGMLIAVYQLDNNKYPKDLSKIFEDQLGLFSSKRFPNPTWEDIVNGRSDYRLLFKSSDSYTGDTNIALIATKPGVYKNGLVLVVFEDGHVERVRWMYSSGEFNSWLQEHKRK